MAQKSVKLRSSKREKYSLVWKISLIAILVIVSLWKLFPSAQYFSLSKDQIAKYDPGDLEKLRSKALNLGLDLQGGIHLVMQVDTKDLDDKASGDTVDRAMKVIENRVNQFGLTEPIVQKQGKNRIIIELPGMKDVDRAKDLIGRTAQLEFKILKSDADIKFITEKIDNYLSGVVDTTKTASADSTKTAKALSDSSAKSDSSKAGVFDETEAPVDQGKKITQFFKYQQSGGDPSFDIIVSLDDVPRVDAILADSTVQNILLSNRMKMLWGPENVREDNKRELFVVSATNEMTGEMIKDARVQVGSGVDAGRPEIEMENTSEGVKEWARITGANVGKRVAIVLDNVVYSAPTVREKIYGGTSRISGAFSNEEAQDLAIVLRAGALPATVEIIEDRTIGPSLGADSIKKSETAFIIGLVAVLVFMLIYYLLAGMVAVFALILDTLFILAYLTFFHATLTLPGIAGIILTIGMAVDANVLIYERIREELRLGNTPKVAVENGFSRATLTILDSNITTFLTGVILYNFGTGPIKGFALTLMVGLAVSVFTALFVSKVVFDILTKKLTVSNAFMGYMRVFTNPSFPFIKYRRIAFALSGALVLAGVISLAVKGGPKYSIDFLGGSLLELHFKDAVKISDIRDSLKQVNVQGTDLSTSEIKFMGTDNKDVMIRIVKVGDMKETSDKVKQAIKENMKTSIPDDLSEWILREEQVGPAIGSELKSQAMWAILFSFIVLIAYIGFRFEFLFGVGAILALIHDTVITVGIFSLLDKEISLSVIAAILTLIGYSLNDTIVVFDRIREKLRKGIQEGYINTIDKAINDTLSRTIITSTTTFITVLALFFFGGAVIHDFSFVLVIGIIVGTYSSIYVAAPLLAEWYLAVTNKNKAKK